MSPRPGQSILVLLPVIAILAMAGVPVAAAGSPQVTPMPTGQVSAPTGQISITSDPVGAGIYLGASTVQAGTTNTVLTLVEGEYLVILRKTNYTDYMAPVLVTAGSVTGIDAVLVPLPPTGTIWVTSRPEKAKIFVDGEFRGLTPGASTETGGTHSVLLTRTGYSDYSDTVNVSTGSTTFVSGVLEPLVSGTGYISVSSSPPGAQVSLDGIPSGATPVIIDSSPGQHSLSLALDGYRGYTTTISLARGETTPVDVVLETAEQVTPAPTPPREAGSISVASFPDGAYVFIDDEMRGATPVKVSGLAPGTYTVRISMQGYADNIQEVPVAGGQTTKVYADLVPTGKMIPGFGAPAAVLSIPFLVAARRRRRV